MTCVGNYKSDLNKQRKLLCFLIAIVITVLGLLVGLRGYYDYRRVTSLHGERLMAQARVINENINANLSTISLIAENINREIKKNGVQLNTYIKTQNDLCPDILAILIINNKGYCTHSSLKYLIGKDFSKRNYFITPQYKSDKNQLFISPPFKNIVGRLTLNITKPLIGKQGEFNGVITISLSPEYFHSLLKSTIYAADNRISLIHSDGTIFTSESYGDNSQIIGQNLMRPDTPLYRHIQGATVASLISGRSAITGDNRVFAFLTNIPINVRTDKHLVVVASRNVDAVLLPWKIDTGIHILLYMAFSALVIAVMRAIDRHNQTLSRANATQTAILESAGEGILGVDGTGNIIFCNQATARMTGLSINELLKSNFHQALHNDVSGHEIADCPLNFTLKDGISRTVHDCVMADMTAVEYTATPLTEQNLVVGAVLVIRDVTEKRKIETERAKNAEFNRALLDSIQAHIAIIDKNAVIISVNDAWKEFADRNRTANGEIPRHINIGTNYIEICLVNSDEDSGQVKEAIEGIRSVLTGSKKKFSLEYPCHSPDAQRWFVMTVEPLKLPEGGAVITHTDITNRKHTEAELQASEERYSSLFENAGDAIMILDTHGRILRTNKVLSQRLGYLENELIGKTPSALDTPRYEELVQTRIGQVIESGEAFFESEHVAKDGTVIPVETRCKVIEINGEAVFMSIVRDITVRKQIEGDLQQALEAAKASYITMSRLLNIVAHEFRTPLGLLIGSVDILDHYWDRISTEKRIEQNDHIRSAANQISNLVNSVTSFNQLGVERIVKITLVPDIEMFCRSIAEEVRKVWGSGQHFNITVDSYCNDCRLDEVQFRRILENLLTNSFRYSPPDGTVSLYLRREERLLHMEITDTGIGIPEEGQKLIFDPFYRCENVAGRRGLGLGLSIVHEAVAQVGGTISVSSIVGEGTTMTVRIPVDPG